MLSILKCQKIPERLPMSLENRSFSNSKHQKVSQKTSEKPEITLIFFQNFSKFFGKSHFAEKKSTVALNALFPFPALPFSEF